MTDLAAHPQTQWQKYAPVPKPVATVVGKQ